MGYVVNGWNNVADNNKDKGVGFFGSFKPAGDNMTLVTNYLVGKESTGNARHILDGIITYDATSNVSVMANYDYGMDKIGTARQTWQGIAAYGKFSVPDTAVFSPRFEWFQDRDGFMTGDAQEMKSFTATVQVPVNGATFWGEYRHDWSDAMVFPNETGFEDKQDTIVFGITFDFMKEIR